MTPRSLLFAALLALAPACDGPPGAPAGEHTEQLWTCSMHPQVIQDRPGTCPICNMDLVKLDASADANVVEIAPGVVQQIGVQTAPVERTSVYRHIRTLGEVEVSEDEVSVVNLRFSGWVERLYVDRTGDEVSAGQVLFDIYSPELVSAQEDYLLAVRTQGADAPLTRSARRRLELWDVASRDIDRLVDAGEVRRTMPVRAPQSGFVLHKDLVEGARVGSGQDLYRIGNLKRIQVTAEVYEHDAAWVDVGQPAQMELTNLAGEVIEGHVAYIYPTLNARSRTLAVRLEFDNPGVRLKPGMFATVYIQYRRLDDVIAVPSEAIMRSGRRQLAFVALGDGRFEPREVTTGLQGDHRMTEVTAGLAEGEIVVVSSQFLIDSESQLQEALRKMRGGSAEAPADGHDHPGTVWSCPMHPEVISDGEGQCTECGMALETRPGTPEELHHVYGAKAEPGQYTCPMHPEVVADEPGRCPRCGMFLEEVGPADADEPTP
jgi:multidrug efflux pump subunit AcrA (membrane-fusion protein)